MELPQGWKKINFYSLNLAYCFFVMFVSLQVGAVKNVLIKAFKPNGEDIYDIINGWTLILLLVTASGAGILGFIRMISVKKIIDVLDKNDRADT